MVIILYHRIISGQKDINKLSGNALKNLYKYVILKWEYQKINNSPEYRDYSYYRLAVTIYNELYNRGLLAYEYKDWNEDIKGVIPTLEDTGYTNILRLTKKNTLLHKPV